MRMYALVDERLSPYMLERQPKRLSPDVLEQSPEERVVK